MHPNFFTWRSGAKKKMEVCLVTKIDMNLNPQEEVAIVPLRLLTEKQLTLLKLDPEDLDNYNDIRFKNLV